MELGLGQAEPGQQRLGCNSEILGLALLSNPLTGTLQKEFSPRGSSWFRQRAKQPLMDVALGDTAQRWPRCCWGRDGLDALRGLFQPQRGSDSMNSPIFWCLHPHLPWLCCPRSRPAGLDAAVPSGSPAGDGFGWTRVSRGPCRARCRRGGSGVTGAAESPGSSPDVPFAPLAEAEGQPDSIVLAERRQPRGGLSQHHGDRTAGAEPDPRPAPRRPLPGSATGLLLLLPLRAGLGCWGCWGLPGLGREEENLPTSFLLRRMG